MLCTDSTLLLIIDIQEKLLNAVFNKEILYKNAITLAHCSNKMDIPVIITEQYPKGLGATCAGIKENINTSKTSIFEKIMFNALEDEVLLKELKSKNKKEILLMGIETHICVYQTAMSLLEKGFKVTIIADACGSRTQKEYDYALNNLNDAGAKIKTTEMVVFELLKGANHPKFKEIQALIK